MDGGRQKRHVSERERILRLAGRSEKRIWKMKTLLLKVEDTFNIGGRGLILAPTIPKETELPKLAVVSLIRPDGSILKTEADFEIPFLSFSRIEDLKKHEPAYNCILRNIDKEEIPNGT